MLILVDNYDSFTYNLYHLFASVYSHIEVIRNDEVTVEEIEEMKPSGIIISPGPGRPEESGITLSCIELAERHSIPLLGVCLGHQAIGYYYGCSIVRAPYPVHGKTDDIYHNSAGLFTGIKNPLRATRYHSLVIERSTVGRPLVICAENREGLVMGVLHESLPIFGVQFHPESFLSEEGEKLAKNFVEVVRTRDGY